MHIQLLGGFTITAGDKPITSINTPRLQALLTYLLLHRSAPQRRQHIAFLFWPDSLEEQAQANLRNLLLVLRRSLPNFDNYIFVDRRTIQWRGDNSFTLDVAEFDKSLAEVARLSEAANGSSLGKGMDKETSANRASASNEPQLLRAMQKVADLYTGDLLPGCYDEWIAGSRERLRLDFLSVMERQADALERSGDIGAAMLYAQRLLRYDSFNEENYRRLMRLHLANDDLAGVARVYRNCKLMLKREFGIEPGSATTAIFEEAKATSVATPRPTRGRGAANEGQVRGPAPTPHVSQFAHPIPTNLPAQTTAFVGREHEVLAVTELLRQDKVRLVTLTGTAGVGKTRLALRTASGFTGSEAARLLPDGVWFVPLASLAGPRSVSNAIAQLFAITESSERAAWDNLLDFLRDKRLLLLLDNFEHLLAASSLVADLLAQCPGLKALVTSRAALNLRGEHEYAVPPMRLPGHNIPLLPDEAFQYEAVTLFMERALEVSPHFTITKDNVRAVVETCRKLEGLPLAIELAAARVKLLTPEAILSRLDRRLKLLVGGKSDLPPRQQTLEAAIAWSYNLLSHSEQALFRRLGVFSGGFTLEAVEAVCSVGVRDRGLGIDPLEGISALVNKSLLRPAETGMSASQPRFGMLETIREYANERLQESGESEALAREHALYFMAFAEEAEPHLLGAKQVEWLARLEEEHDNLLEALRWARRFWPFTSFEGQNPKEDEKAAREASEIGQRIAGALSRFWELRGYFSEGREQLAGVLGIGDRGSGIEDPPTDLRSLIPDPSVLMKARAKALDGAGILAWRQGDPNEARSLHEKSLALRRELGDKAGVAASLTNLGVVAWNQGDYEAARALYEESLPIRREMGDKQGIARSLNNLGLVIRDRGDYELARSLHEESLALRRELGDKAGIAASLHNLAMVARNQGDDASARSLYEESLVMKRELGDKRGIAYSLINLAIMVYGQGDYESARSLQEESLALLRELGDKWAITSSLLNHAQIAQKQRNTESAKQLYEESLNTAYEIGDKVRVALCLAGLAGLAAMVGASGAVARAGEPSPAGAQLLGAADTLLGTVGAVLEVEDKAEREWAEVLVRTQLDDEAFAKAWSEGRSMSMEQAIALAQGLP